MFLPPLEACCLWQGGAAGAWLLERSLAVEEEPAWGGTWGGSRSM